jgi:hypothetical protein
VSVPPNVLVRQTSTRLMAYRPNPTFLSPSAPLHALLTFFDSDDKQIGTSDDALLDYYL